MDERHFWHIRSANYDKLFWTKDDSYLSAILKAADLKKNQTVLDVGTGTGIMAQAIKPHVKHVIGLDISDSMLGQGRWQGISLVKWDIAEDIFVDSLFDRIMARMVFHHILGGLDQVFQKCRKLLKPHGKLVVAEGLPPSPDFEAVSWYTKMFRLKEKRRTFTEAELVSFFRRNGFSQVEVKHHVMRNFSIKNWLANSGLNKKLQATIMAVHLKAPDNVKQAYRMKITRGDCVVETKNLIITGAK